MLWYDWLIITVPVLFVLYMGVYSRRYLKDVTTFLSAGRVCGRYVISVGDIANAISIIGLLSYVEVHYKTGMAMISQSYQSIGHSPVLSSGSRNDFYFTLIIKTFYYITI